MSQATIHANEKFPWSKGSRLNSKIVEQATQDLKEMLGKNDEVTTRVVSG